MFMLILNAFCPVQIKMFVENPHNLRFLSAHMTSILKIYQIGFMAAVDHSKFHYTERNHSSISCLGDVAIKFKKKSKYDN